MMIISTPIYTKKERWAPTPLLKCVASNPSRSARKVRVAKPDYSATTLIRRRTDSEE